MKHHNCNKFRNRYDINGHTIDHTYQRTNRGHKHIFVMHLSATSPYDPPSIRALADSYCMHNHHTHSEQIVSQIINPECLEYVVTYTTRRQS